MPVPALIGLPPRDHHHMPHARRNFLLAPRADVGLAGLIGVDDPHLDVAARFGLVITRAAGVSAHSLILVLPPGPRAPAPRRRCDRPPTRLSHRRDSFSAHARQLANSARELSKLQAGE